MGRGAASVTSRKGETRNRDPGDPGPKLQQALPDPKKKTLTKKDKTQGYCSKVSLRPCDSLGFFFRNIGTRGSGKGDLCAATIALIRPTRKAKQ